MVPTPGPMLLGHDTTTQVTFYDAAEILNAPTALDWTRPPAPAGGPTHASRSSSILVGDRPGAVL